MKDSDGASELTTLLLETGESANSILKRGLMVGMDTVGAKFANGQAFIPELLVAAKAMNAAMVHLKPYFESGEAKHRGSIVIGTIQGDLHDIGKNIVGMVLKGAGWNVIDLGSNVSADKFITALRDNNCKLAALSALLTTTMLNMESVVGEIKGAITGSMVFIGGAPLSNEFSDKIDADGYFPDPHTFSKYLSTLNT
ncbi:MAG: cobalamin-binding protein [Calditrichaeota bacterium]|nr:cobalamin-binding protein [Calditrichota bacterium]MBT7619187.1 cobalamin-binding protein [Calditrichota bacterium]MBT7787443.1 cobalamin-binding protein [Calditrichota bacterium]